jgi:hypothetical protein
MKNGKYRLIAENPPYIRLQRGKKGSILHVEPGLEMIGVDTINTHYDLSMDVFHKGTETDMKELSAMPDLPLEELMEIRDLIIQYEKSR